MILKLNDGRYKGRVFQRKLTGRIVCSICPTTCR